MWIRPLGLLYIGSMLREAGCSVELIDCLERRERPADNDRERLYGCAKFHKEEIDKPDALSFVPRKYSRYGLSLIDFEEKLKKVKPPDLIFATTIMTYWYGAAADAIKILRSHFPGSKIVLGGKYPQICYEHALEKSGADVVVSSKDFDEIVKETFDIIDLNRVPVAFDSARLPYPAYDLYDDLKYVALLTSVGCPFKCTYCYTPISSQKFKKRQNSSVTGEIEHWNKNFGVRNFAFYDDALNYRAKERLMPILETIRDSGLQVFLHTPNAINARWIDPDQADLMREAGFKTVRLGFETSDPEEQKAMGSKISVDEFERGCRYLKEAGFSFDDLGAYILAGIPGQSVADLKRDIDYLLDCGVRPYLAEYSPIPGTEMFKRAMKASKFDLNEPLYHNNSILPLQGETMGYKEIEEVKGYLRECLKQRRL